MCPRKLVASAKTFAMSYGKIFSEGTDNWSMENIHDDDKQVSWSIDCNKVVYH